MSKKIKKSTHVHKYKRMNIARNPDAKPYWVFTCMQPACNHYIAIKLALSKLAECWICGDPFIIDKVSIEHAKPHCVGCIKRKIKPEVADLTELVKDI